MLQVSVENNLRLPPPHLECCVRVLFSGSSPNLSDAYLFESGYIPLGSFLLKDVESRIPDM